MRKLTVTPSAGGWDITGDNYLPFRVERDGDHVLLFHPEGDRRSAYRVLHTDDIRADVEVLLRARLDTVLDSNMPDVIEWAV